MLTGVTCAAPRDKVTSIRRGYSRSYGRRGIHFRYQLSAEYAGTHIRIPVGSPTTGRRRDLEPVRAKPIGERDIVPRYLLAVVSGLLLRA